MEMNAKLEVTLTGKLRQLDNILKKDNATLEEWQEICKNEK